ncbi:MAG: HaeII family restriction endonuclease [Ktedonobacteraceae bacterium]
MSQTPSLTEAKKRLDKIINKSRTDLYKPIQIAEVLYHSRIGDPQFDIQNLESFRRPSIHWRDEVTHRLLSKASTSSARFQDNLWEANAMIPILLNFLDEENKGTGGAVEKYIYLRFQERQETIGSIITIAETATPQTFDIKSLFNVFDKTKAIRRSIDKVYEVVVYSLMETVVVELGTQITVSIPENKSPLLTEFSDIAKLLFGLNTEQREHTLPAHVYRAGVTNAADRGLDMWTNFGPTIQVKHITLDKEKAEELVDKIESDNIIVVCTDAHQEVIDTVIRQIGWGKKVRSIVTKTELVNWYERCLKGTYANLLGQRLLDRLSQEFKKEFARVLAIPSFLEERRYLEIPSPELWSIDILQELENEDRENMNE